MEQIFHIWKVSFPWYVAINFIFIILNHPHFHSLPSLAIFDLQKRVFSWSKFLTEAAMFVTSYLAYYNSKA